MKDFLRKLFSWESTYLVKVTLSKHGGSYYPRSPRSKAHKGNKINNQFMDIMIRDIKPPELKDILATAKETYPKYKNLEVVSITKID